MRRRPKSSSSFFKTEAVFIVLVSGIPIGAGLFLAFVVPALLELLR